jgi:hypothetical protein
MEYQVAASWKPKIGQKKMSHSNHIATPPCKNSECRVAEFHFRKLHKIAPRNGKKLPIMNTMQVYIRVGRQAGNYLLANMHGGAWGDPFILLE